jgi:DNA-binding Xre family transcriptional regulator
MAIRIDTLARIATNLGCTPAELLIDRPTEWLADRLEAKA